MIKVYYPLGRGISSKRSAESCHSKSNTHVWQQLPHSAAKGMGERESTPADVKDFLLFNQTPPIYPSDRRDRIMPRDRLEAVRFFSVRKPRNEGRWVRRCCGPPPRTAAMDHHHGPPCPCLPHRSSRSFWELSLLARRWIPEHPKKPSAQEGLVCLHVCFPIQKHYQYKSMEKPAISFSA